jgi:hypothetical protein
MKTVMTQTADHWDNRSRTSTCPSVEESRDCLRRAGWSVGEIASATRWMVTGTNGDNLLHAESSTQGEAWNRACEQARALGMLAPWRGEADDATGHC